MTLYTSKVAMRTQALDLYATLTGKRPADGEDIEAVYQLLKHLGFEFDGTTLGWRKLAGKGAKHDD